MAVPNIGCADGQYGTCISRKKSCPTCLIRKEKKMTEQDVGSSVPEVVNRLQDRIKQLEEGIEKHKNTNEWDSVYGNRDEELYKLIEENQ